MDCEDRVNNLWNRRVQPCESYERADKMGDSYKGKTHGRIGCGLIATRRRSGASPEISPAFVARAARRRCDRPHGPKDAEGVADTTSKRLEGVQPVTAHGSASAAGSW